MNGRFKSTKLGVSFILPLADLAEIVNAGHLQEAGIASKKALQHVIEEVDSVFMVAFILKKENFR